MKVTLAFNLPDESEELHNALHGTDYRAILQNLDNDLRSKIKHGDLSPEKITLLEAIRTLIHSGGVDIWD